MGKQVRKKGPSFRRKRGRASFTVAELFYRQKGRCFYCRCAMDLGGSGPSRATRDHFIPRSRGGKQAGNLVGACYTCNHTKSAMSADEFIAWYEAQLKAA